MRRLITLSGPGGRGVLEIAEEGGLTRCRLKPDRGRLYLVDRGGRTHPYEGPVRMPAAGALVLEKGRVILSGGFAGRSELERRARQELMLSLSAPGPLKNEASGPQSRRQPEPRPQERGSGCQSRTLLEILRKAAELFPPEPGPEPEPEPDDAVANPFPGAFPFSRWRRVGYPGTDRYYLEGETVRGGAEYVLHALPGEWRRRPAARGFDRFLRARDGGGYWVRIRKR